MIEQEPVKVYELAKELGLSPLMLVEKLKGMGMNVKSHMSDLTDDQVVSAKTAFAPKSIIGTKTEKKPAVRTRKKAAPAAEKAAPPVTPEEAHAEKKSAAPVIRRRTKTEDGHETVTATVVGTEHAITSPTPVSLSGEPTLAEEHIEERVIDASTLVFVPLQQPEQEQPALVVEETPEAPPAVAGEETVQTVSPAPAEPVMGTPEAPVHVPAAPQPTTPPKVVKKPIVLAPRPVAPRRSILKIVEPNAPTAPRIVATAPPSSSQATKTNVKGTATADKDGYRIIKMTKENLDQMVEEEAARKRGGGKEKEHDIRPEDVRFADYRKKEMVFLPKKKKVPVGKEIKRTQITTPSAQKRVVEMQETISVQDLATQLSVKATDVIKKLMMMGQMATINQSLDFDTATLVAGEYKYEVKNVSFKEDAALASGEDTVEDLKPRPPIVTIMGHVDHGKTTLLDAIRESNVAEGEAGGITQHIGAYSIEKNGKKITFIDTPGHEAFTVMRARGANVTDIVILVVSADDGVMPQTREAVSHAQAAKVPIIVAINKMDKPGANPEKIKQSLAELNLLSEDWGGETMFIPVSALKKQGIDKLLDSILLQAEVLELKGNPSVRASGTVLESRIEKGRGPVVSLLVSRGTLKTGDAIVSGTFTGRVKAMTDHKGAMVKEAPPAFAVEVLGFEGVPNAGDLFNVTPDEATARQIAQNRIDKAREKASAPVGKVSLEDLFSKIQTGDMKELSVVLKADVFGSVEAIRDSLTKISTEKVKVKVIHAAPGGITESDVMLASASNAIIIGFNVRPETKARQVAEAEHIEIKCYNIIYELLDEVKLAMAGLLEKTKVEKYLGRAEVRQIFSIPKIGVIAGSSVVDGKIIRGASVRLLRESRIIYEGKMSSLRRFKDDAKEVAQGFECGIGIENYHDLKPGDLIEAYTIELVTPTLDA